MDSGATQKKPEATSVTAAVVDPSDTDAPAYAMFELTRLSPEGAFLAGVIFFERGEELLIELAASDRDPVRVRARVVSCEQGDRPGMEVEFQGMTDAQREEVRKWPKPSTS